MTSLSSPLMPWLPDAGLQRLFAAIRASGGEARAVGGAVRDGLLGRAVTDIDIAVNRTPEQVIAALTAAGIKSVPTGLAHGTITAVLDHKGYELTSLRRDVATDGRHAVVAFTDDWAADAARRDFTINALYVDADGALYDYVGGQADLARNRVRFIGDAQARITEDVLRILRFFRFTAWFGQGAADAEGLAACRALAGMIPQLSVERVWREIVKLLAADHPAPVWRLMQESGVLAHILPEATNIARLGSLRDVEARYALDPAPLVRLAALLPPDQAVARAIAQRLKLSKRESEHMLCLAALPAVVRGKLDPVPLRRLLYTHGAKPIHDAVVLQAAAQPTDIESALAIIAAWDKPHFPLQGADLLAMGLAAGPKVGLVLAATEEWWIACDFLPTRAECLAEAERVIGGCLTDA